MSEMSQYLSEFYGTNGTAKTAGASDDDTIEQAQVELFCKVAAEQNIPIGSMPDTEVQQLFENFLAKTGGDEGDTVDEAEQEFEEKKAAAEEFARYDFFGRQMAHAYVDELKKIAADGEEDGDDDGDSDDDGGKLSAAKPGLWKALKGHAETAKKEIGGAFKATQFKKGLEGQKARKHKDFEPWLKKHVKGTSKPGARGSDAAHIRKDTRNKVYKDLAVGGAKTVGAYGGSAAALGGAGYGIHRATKKKESSALDSLAMEQAIYKAAEAGYDPDVAAERIGAVAILGLGDSVKLAQAGDLEDAVGIRALEFLEAANYPVNWAA